MLPAEKLHNRDGKPGSILCRFSWRAFFQFPDA
jgi:hypothetical protein